MLPITPRLPKGFRDLDRSQLFRQRELVAAIAKVYDLYGFHSLETSFLEYTDCLGEDLNGSEAEKSIFVLEEPNSDIGLRYDLTASLARYVAQNFQNLVKPYKSYRVGSVFRNEKADIGRFRQFVQMDADIVGADSNIIDGEMIQMSAVAMERAGLKASQFNIKLSDRSLLHGLLEQLGFENSASKKLGDQVLRVLDKYDRIGIKGVESLLSEGKLDSSGAFVRGLGLSRSVIVSILDFLMVCQADSLDNYKKISALEKFLGNSSVAMKGIENLNTILSCVGSSLQMNDCLVIDPTIVRGLAYYTGTVFEIDFDSSCVTGLDNKSKNKLLKIGALGGGGRYDRLLEKFDCGIVPSVGFAIGISRLSELLSIIDPLSLKTDKTPGPVLVVVFDESCMLDYYKIVEELRINNIPSEIYAGVKGLKAQLKYADRRRSPCVIICGENEQKAGKITIKDLQKGKLVSKQIESNEQWREQRPAQFSVERKSMIVKVHEIMNNNK